jgi:hypothetical protein
MTGLAAPGVTGPGMAPAGADRYSSEFAVTDLPDLPDEWLVELGSAPIPVDVLPPSLGQPGGGAVGAVPDAAAAVTNPPVVWRYSLRGWIGEPGDAAMPNTAYLRRLVEAPSLVRSMRVLPEDSARLSFQAGELLLDNSDGALDYLLGAWTMAGQPATVRRGPHRTPIRAGYSEFGRVADLRITSPARRSSRLSIGLQASASDLSVPVCSVYAGTGGLEGDASLAGQNRPRLLGYKRQIKPTPLLATQLVWQVTEGVLLSVDGVRDGGAPLTPVGDFPTLAALLAASLPQSSFATCRAFGLIRTGSPPAGQITVDAQAAGDGSHGGIALALLLGPGGLDSDRIVAGSFAALPPGLAGWVWRSGTVAAALDQVLSSCAGWWGSDRLGRIVAGRLTRPDLVGPRATFDRWMLTAEPTEDAGAAPRWRQRVAYRVLDTVQSGTDLFGIASSNPALVAAYGTAQQVATAYDTSISVLYPSATDPEPLVSGFDAEGDAQTLAVELLALHGVRRRRWRVPVGKWGHLVDLGDIIAVEHPLLGDRNWCVIGAEQSGDAITLRLWG